MPKKQIKKWLKLEQEFIDSSIYVVSALYPLTTVPQIIKIYSTQDATGVSILTWTLYFAFTVVFLLYSINKKLKPLIISYIMWLIVDFVIIFGLILYR